MIDKPDLHVRVDERTMLELRALADARNEPPSKVASDLITRALMGELYVVRLAAARLLRAGVFGNEGE